MSNSLFPFTCRDCGEDFGKDPIKLALHIAKNHDERPSRSKND